MAKKNDYVGTDIVDRKITWFRKNLLDFVKSPAYLSTSPEAIDAHMWGGFSVLVFLLNTYYTRGLSHAVLESFRFGIRKEWVSLHHWRTS